MGPPRRFLVPMLAAAAAVAVALVAPADSDARPRISSFHVKDEGSAIGVKVNYCDDSADRADSYSTTVRLWDEGHSGSTMVFEGRMLGRIYDRCVCGSASFTIRDDFASGLYSAGAVVTNRATGRTTRIGPRPFTIR